MFLITADQFNRLLKILGCGPDCPIGPTHKPGEIMLDNPMEHLLSHIEKKLSKE